MSASGSGPLPSDEDQIRDLMYRYARLADQGKYIEWLELFAEGSSYSAITYENFHDQGLYLFKDDGKEALKERVAFLMGFWQVSRGKTLHTVSNIEVSDLKDGAAKARSYFVIYRTGEGGTTQFHACGEYDDVLAKQHDGWLFRQRRAIVDNAVLPSHFTDLL